ncbi:peptide chain release factor N(5)-glutamine methyltransferase [Maribacter sp. 2307ULW6-5]|uniref:peptide chain release factor N(5)-glutamine methyltransferase n=1 Tax=Maribacter sp. 2307ULW6-5 TaxID=3386275 RepID=UPI0039BD4A66
MLLREIKRIYHQELDVHYGAPEVSSFFHLLTHHYLGLEKFVLAVQPELVLGKEEETPLFQALSRLKQMEPVQYIIGETEFMDLKFKVNPAVLIPRPETEELVRWVLDDFSSAKTKDAEAAKILDVGTGSGCIAISLAENMADAKVYGMDISEDALAVARSNGELHQVDVHFFKADVLAREPTVPAEVVYDCIVSNPPYVRRGEKHEMQPNVLQYEPHGALFVPDQNPLVFYRALATFAKRHLCKKGKLFMEVNQYLAKETLALFVAFGFDQLELRQDMYGNERMLRAVRP